MQHFCGVHLLLRHVHHFTCMSWSAFGHSRVVSSQREHDTNAMQTWTERSKMLSLSSARAWGSRRLALGKQHILVGQLKDLPCRVGNSTKACAPTSSRESGLRCPLVSWRLQPIFHVQLVTTFQRTSHNLDWDFHLIGNSQ